MKKISLVILFWMGLFSIARAEWVLYGDNGKAAFYYDPSTVLVQNNRVTVWEMLDYSFPLNRVLSNKSHKEFDCADLTFRYLAGEFFDQKLLQGELISKSQEPEEDWRSVAEGTRNHELMTMVCPKWS
jgi:hypothetical protein